MIFARWVLCCFLLCAPLVCAASDASTLKIPDDLKGKVVFLRGMEVGNRISFDAQGVATGRVETGPFASSAVKIEKTHQSGKKLEIEGERVFIFFKPSSSPTWYDLNFADLPEQRVDISVAIDKANPEALKPALEKIFAATMEDALSNKSIEEKKAAIASIAMMYPPGAEPKPSEPSPLPPGVYSVGPGVSPPRLIHSVDPSFTDDARRLKISGICAVSTIVDTSGRPTNIRVLHSVNPGLDQNAVKAVEQYRFKPAIYQGRAVPVQINIEINFRLR